METKFLFWNLEKFSQLCLENVVGNSRVFVGRTRKNPTKLMLWPSVLTQQLN